MHVVMLNGAHREWLANFSQMMFKISTYIDHKGAIVTLRLCKKLLNGRVFTFK